MSVGFFYLLRARGLHATLNEWMTQPEGLTLGPHRNSLTGFYVLCRAVPVHTEADYDKFDSVFLEYFGGVPFEGDALGEELLNRLKKPEDVMRAFRAFPDAADYKGKSESYWGESWGKIARVVDMYPLSVAGPERAMKKLLVSK